MLGGLCIYTDGCVCVCGLWLVMRDDACRDSDHDDG
jgi:hypothetical protein